MATLKNASRKAARKASPVAAPTNEQLLSDAAPRIMDAAEKGESGAILLKKELVALAAAKAVTCKDDLRRVTVPYVVGCLKAHGMSEADALASLKHGAAKTAEQKRVIASAQKAIERATKVYGWNSFDGRGGARPSKKTRAPRMAGSTAPAPAAVDGVPVVAKSAQGCPAIDNAAPVAAPETKGLPLSSYRPSRINTGAGFALFLQDMARIMDQTLKASASVAMAQEARLINDFVKDVAFLYGKDAAPAPAPAKAAPAPAPVKAKVAPAKAAPVVTAFDPATGRKIAEFEAPRARKSRGH